MQEQLIHTLATVFLEISYLATGIALCIIGNSLIKKRISSDFHAEGEFDSKKFKLITSSPGLVFLTVGMIIIIYTIITPSEFEKKVTEQGYSAPVDSTLISEGTAINTERSTSVSSKLLEQQSLNNAIFSKIAIYSLLLKNEDVPFQDVTSEIRNMPTEIYEESWTQTQNRIKSILRKNPQALLSTLEKPEFQWILNNNETSIHLESLIDSELELLKSRYNTYE